jgi:hypothetical protein
MPMGNSDRMRNYISDYLENSLDPSTHKEFEDALKRSPDLRSMTDRMTILTSHLNNFEYHKCSDEFSVKLRERIHTTSEPLISRQNIIRYSFAASFVIILIIAIFTITNLSSESPENIPAMQEASGSPANKPNPVSGNDANSYADEEEMNIGTKPDPNAAGDSTSLSKEHNQNKPAIKQVDKK